MRRKRSVECTAWELEAYHGVSVRAWDGEKEPKYETTPEARGIGADLSGRMCYLSMAKYEIRQR